MKENKKNVHHLFLFLVKNVHHLVNIVKLKVKACRESRWLHTKKKRGAYLRGWSLDCRY